MQLSNIYLRNVIFRSCQIPYKKFQLNSDTDSWVHCILVICYLHEKWIWQHWKCRGNGRWERYPKVLGIRETIVYDYHYTSAKEPWALHSPLNHFQRKNSAIFRQPTLMLAAICHFDRTSNIYSDSLAEVQLSMCTWLKFISSSVQRLTVDAWVSVGSNLQLANFYFHAKVDVLVLDFTKNADCIMFSRNRCRRSRTAC